LALFAVLSSEVVVLDGVAYHQGANGVKVLKGDERTPFMTVTLFDKSRCKQVRARCLIRTGRYLISCCLSSCSAAQHG